MIPLLKTLLGGGAAGLVATAMLAAPMVHAEAKKPNVIYILADDLGYGDLGCFGQKLIKTPSLDKMAAEGMKFTHHYSGSTVCAPSRCVLLTGKHTGHSFIRGNGEFKNGQRPIPDEEFTMAEMFKKQGYATSCIGKWGLGWLDSTGHPNKQGFDHFFGYLCQRRAHSYYPDFLWRNDQKVPLEGNNFKKGPHYSHDLLTEEAQGFIKENKDKPFFLYLAYAIPHTKFQVPELGEYEKTDWQPNQKVQAAMISRMDRDCGKLMDLLKELKIDENTLVIFTSDNGPHGFAGTLEKFDANGPFKGRKRDLFEGGVRVPMIAYWPGKIKAGSESGHISAFWDWMPTFADLLGADLPEGLDGISFANTLLGKGDQKKHDHLYWEFYEQGGKQAVLQWPWKAVRLGVSKDRKAPIALYNLEKDIGETTNLVDKHPEVAKKMVGIMEASHKPSEHFEFKVKPKTGKRGKKR